MGGSSNDSYEGHQLLCTSNCSNHNGKRDSTSFLIVLSNGPGVKSDWPHLGHMPSPEPAAVAREMQSLDGPGLDCVDLRIGPALHELQVGIGFPGKGETVSFMRTQWK